MHPGALKASAVAHDEIPPDAWDAIAPGYDRTNTPSQMRLGSEGLLHVGLRAGMSFLDVAAGSGALAIPAARLGANVTAIDQSPAMLDLLAQRARRENLRIECDVMDGHALGFHDDTFDIVGSQFGVMLFPDMPKGIREMVRVTRPGGKVLVTAYGDPHSIDFLTLFVLAVRTLRPDFSGPPSDPPPLPFQLQDPRRLRNELVDAGLEDVQVETITESTPFTSGAAFWDWLISSNPIVAGILEELSLSGSEREALVHTIEELVRQRATVDGITTLFNPVNVGIGVK
ncbi:class I SAM-dependent methyltransferase [Povalibacter sp.]|uniref:class I SAM-dependent methyltransferase n=1 Tax=Povalibacter sp. TaxID=1962978 RepID=UPI002F412E9D